MHSPRETALQNAFIDASKAQIILGSLHFESSLLHSTPLLALSTDTGMVEHHFHFANQTGFLTAGEGDSVIVSNCSSITCTNTEDQDGVVVTYCWRGFRRINQTVCSTDCIHFTHLQTHTQQHNDCIS